MQQRVACHRCGAHRDRALDRPGVPPVCLVCRNDGADCILVPLNAADLESLARRVIARVLSVYREDYIAHCVAQEPDSLLALVKQLEAALDLGAAA